MKKTIEEKIKELDAMQIKTSKRIADILDSLYEQVEELFKKISICGICGSCTACYSDNSNEEQGVILGDLAFTDGGPCYGKGVFIKTDNYDIWERIYTIDKDSLEQKFSPEYKIEIINSIKNIKNAIEEKINSEKKIKNILDSLESEVRLIKE